MPVLPSALQCPLTAADHPSAEAPLRVGHLTEPSGGRGVIPPPRGITAVLHSSASSPHAAVLGQQVLAAGAPRIL